MASIAAPAYAAIVPARRIRDPSRAASTRAMPPSRSGSILAAISRRPDRSLSSNGMVGLRLGLAEEEGKAPPCLEHVDLGRRRRAVQDLCHLGQRSVLVVVERHRGAL